MPGLIVEIFLFRLTIVFIVLGNCSETDRNTTSERNRTAFSDVYRRFDRFFCSNTTLTSNRVITRVQGCHLGP